MQLIGMLDSPYVRRVAITLHLLNIAFEHRSISVFSTFEQFKQLNPVVKAPTLVCDDGTVLMDSNLILDYVEAAAGRSLWPADLQDLRHALRVVGLALAACEKSVQIVYEHKLRPADKLHAPWLERVQQQLVTAYAELEAELVRVPLACTAAGMTQAGVTAAVAWQFSQMLLPPLVGDLISEAAHPVLTAFSAQAETLPAFQTAPPL
ncbi:glutathione S-transferase [Variovorax sp. HJSM1_2]|uniref:glutathione S-transferase n=1 Tax=Variovorax sp. HJSM1_2 TaxID=3366263 RepID=UPI003BE41612